MRLHKHALLIVAILVIVRVAPPAQAQDSVPEPHPLIQMMSMTPADAAALDPEYMLMSYTDLRANQQARPGVPTPESLAEFMALDETASSLWFSNSYRLISPAPDLQNTHSFDTEMVDYLGFDYFHIDQSFVFGMFPVRGELFRGHNINIDRVIDTYTKRGYTTTELNGIPVLCGPVDCENGNEFRNWLPDQEESDPQTGRRSGVYPLFGGNLGRQQPIALLPEMLFSSPDWETLDQMTAAAEGRADSLYDVPEYRAIADFAVQGGDEDTASPLLIQVYFLPPIVADPEYMMYLVQEWGIDEDDLDTMLERMEVDMTGLPVDAGELPYYTAGAIVDWQEGDDQVHSLVLAYDNEADAQRAAEEMTLRIPLQSALRTIWMRNSPVIDLVVEEYTLEPPQAVYNPAADRWLAVATVRTPTLANIPPGRLMDAWYDLLLIDAFIPVQIAPLDE